MMFKKTNRKVFLGLTLKKYGKKIIMPWRRLIVMIVFLSLIPFLNQIVNENALAQASATTGKVAFTHEKFKPNIYVVDDDGSNLTPLTNTNKDSFPAWSPDGQQIAFASGRNHAGSNALGQIYVMNADGTDQRPLTNPTGGIGDSMPDWAPDGKTMAFVRDDRDIYLMNSDGSNQRRLFAGGIFPVFSPDGEKIAFMAGQAGGLWVINLNGTGLVKVHTFEMPCRCNISWSPNGRWLAFTGWGGQNQWEIFRINADGTDPINLTNHPAIDGHPAWSSDSTKIAFSSVSREGWNSQGVYVMNADGTGVVRITSIGATSLDWYGPSNLADEGVGIEVAGKLVTSWGKIKSKY